jgi:DNA primase
MAFYNEQFIDEVKSNNNIVDVISDYVTLRRTGTSYKGLCPFHKEKTPSFSVSSDKQIFHCFGCGIGGDVVKFVMNIENISFKEAVEVLADRAKMELPQDNEVVDIERVKLKERLYKMNVDTAKYFYQNLLSSKEAIAYINKRKLDEQTVKKFGLGFANGSNNDLRKRSRSFGLFLIRLIVSASLTE